MKVHFPFPFLWPAIIFAAFAQVGCYSVEFYPDADYPNLRRDDVDEVEIRTGAPRRPYARLGNLLIKDAAADLSDPNFRRFLKSQARDRGAGGVWILSRGRYSNAVITGSPGDSRYGGGGGGIQTGQIDLDRGVLTVTLFNYLADPADDAGSGSGE